MHRWQPDRPWTAPSWTYFVPGHTDAWMQASTHHPYLEKGRLRHTCYCRLSHQPENDLTRLHQLHTMSVVITGSPGVGKHTISKKIAKRLGYAIIDTNRVAADAGLAGPDGVVDTDMLGSMMGPTDEAVIVGHLAPYALDAGQTGTVIILRRNPYELVRVYQSRGYPEEKIRDNAGSEILGVIAAYSLEKFGEKAFGDRHHRIRHRRVDIGSHVCNIRGCAARQDRLA